MREGADNKTKLRMAIALVIAAVLAVTWALMSGSAPAPAPAPAAAVAPAPQIKGSTSVSESTDPRLRLDLLANSEDVKYQGKGKNIFSATGEPIGLPVVKVSPLLRQQQAAKRNVYIPPPPPPINLKFFGMTNSKGEKPKVFLSQGDDVWIAREGDVVNRHYKIVRISPNTVEVEDLLNNNRQNIPLTQG
jgi:hypothetical protein